MRPPSYIKNKPPPKRRRYNLNRIKLHRTYDKYELAKLLNVHKNTIALWVKAGLPALPAIRPLLFYGEVIKAFLQEKQGKRKQKCGFDKLYCFKCRKPQKPALGEADLTFKSDTIGHLTALCEECHCVMSRNINLNKLPEFQKSFAIIKRGEARISASPKPRYICD